MSDAYKGARLITTAGYTLGITFGVFLGVLNGTTAQTIQISGRSTYPAGATYPGAITFAAGPGQLIPVKCSYIKPTSFHVWGLFD